MIQESDLFSESVRRVFTALVLGALVVYLLFAGAVQFLVLMTIVVMIGALEWGIFINIPTKTATYHKVFYAVVVFVVSAGGCYLVHLTNTIYFVLIVNAFFWFWVITLIVSFERGRAEVSMTGRIWAIVGVFVFFSAVSSVGYLFAKAPIYVFVLLGTIWSADIFSYVGGKCVGRRKFVSRTSPKKTWEGVFTGAIGSGTTIWVLNDLFLSLQDITLVFLFLITFFGSIVGDLLESFLKRTAKIKHTGRLLPGHGGMLDRIDSVLAAAPAFTSVIVLAELL